MSRKFSVIGVIFLGIFCLGCDLFESIIMDYNAVVFLEETGANPQSLVMDDNHLYLLNSDNNSIWRVDLEGNVEKNFAELGDSSDAFYMSKSDNYFFVSKFNVGRIDVVEKSSGRVVSSSKEKITNPVESLYVKGKLFVAVSEYSLNESNRYFGSLNVYNVGRHGKLSLEKRLESGCNHTVGVAYWKEGDKLISISTGRSDEEGCIDIYDAKSLKLSKTMVLGKDVGGSSVIIEDNLYVSGTKGQIFIVDLKKEEVRSDKFASAGPMSLCIMGYSKILVSSFNDDQLYVYSPLGVDRKVNFGGDSKFGPGACVDGKDGPYVIMSTARKLYKVLSE